MKHIEISIGTNKNRVVLELSGIKNGKKKDTKHFKNGFENSFITEWGKEGRKAYEENFVDGNE